MKGLIIGSRGRVCNALKQIDSGLHQFEFIATTEFLKRMDDRALSFAKVRCVFIFSDISKEVSVQNIIDIIEYVAPNVPTLYCSTLSLDAKFACQTRYAKRKKLLEDVTTKCGGYIFRPGYIVGNSTFTRSSPLASFKIIPCFADTSLRVFHVLDLYRWMADQAERDFHQSPTEIYRLGVRLQHDLFFERMGIVQGVVIKFPKLATLLLRWFSCILPDNAKRLLMVDTAQYAINEFHSKSIQWMVVRFMFSELSALSPEELNYKSVGMRLLQARRYFHYDSIRLNLYSDDQDPEYIDFLKLTEAIRCELGD